MPRRAAPHRGIDVHYGEPLAFDEDGAVTRPSKTRLKQQSRLARARGFAVFVESQRFAVVDIDAAVRCGSAGHR